MPVPLDAGAAACGACPRFEGGQGYTRHLNEFGQIAGFSITGTGALRAALWTPTAGPLAVAPADGRR